MRSARQEKMVELVKDKGFVTTDELCNLLSASQATVRRDIATLDSQGRIHKTHGGAMSSAKFSMDDMPMPLRWHIQREEKARIATAALELILEGDSIFLDSGTTTFELAAKLSAIRNLTILTNDINIAYEISKNSSNNLIVTGGIRKKSSATLMGVFAEQMLSQLHVDKAFLSVDAVDVKSGLMDYNMDEIPIKRRMIENSRMRIVLCDHTKFSNKAFMSICGLDIIDMIITGAELDSEIAEAIKEAGANLRTVT